MSTMGFMVDRCIDPSSVPTLVDLGNVNDKAARDFADRLRAGGLSRRNFSVEGFGRLLVKLPPKKAAALIKQFRIKAGGTYWQCTHHRPGLKP